MTIILKLHWVIYTDHNTKFGWFRIEEFYKHNESLLHRKYGDVQYKKNMFKTKKEDKVWRKLEKGGVYKVPALSDSVYRAVSPS